MHRFRKRSDARRPLQLDTEVSVSVRTDVQDVLPSLPPASDFRTSLILPDLTRRFSVLRNSSGEPIGLDELKSKLAEQRARGSQNLVSEEEEDMILEALGRLHSRSRSRSKKSGYEEGEAEDDDAEPTRQSVRSSNSVTSPSLHAAPSIASISSAKGSQSSRRMSNNLFGSGKFRDQAYLLRTATPRRGVRGAGLIALSDSNTSVSTVESVRGEQSTSMYSDSLSLRPITPEDSSYTFSGSAPSSPGNTSTLSKDRSSRISDSDYSSTLNKRLSKALSPEGLRRASMALDQAIRELEEEGDDEIVMERSPIAHVPPSIMNGSLSALSTAAEDSSSPAPSPSEYETGTALSSDDPVVADEGQRSSPYPGSRTTSPTPRLPGYIPGMPRPMTPHDAAFDREDLTPSATPRATSPRLPSLNTPSSPLISQTLMSSMHRSNSSTSSYQPNRPSSPATATTAPLFFNRSMNGRHTPEERQRNGNKQPSPTSDTESAWRRPLSPLSSPIYQSLTSSPSRPTTPSNVTWSMPSPNGTPQKTTGRRSRSGSTTSINDQLADPLERSKSITRSQRSPASPDSSWLDGATGNGNGSAIAHSEYSSPSAMSGVEPGSPAQLGNATLRSPTPTYSGTRSPTTAFSDTNGIIGVFGDGRSPSMRSSKQSHPTSSSTFSLGQPNALLFSPIANSSRSSLESAGSSYHTWDEDHKRDRLFGMFSSLDPDNAPWHDISPDKSSSSTAGTSPYDTTEAEHDVRKEIGLTKSDFIAIQNKLIGAALTKSATPENRRAGSIRKRRPSTSQSNYSYNGERAANSTTPQPPPQQQLSVSPPRPTTSEQMAKANALLNAVVDSIESPRTRPPEISPAEEPSLSVPVQRDVEQSSPMRRNRALAEALFGAEDSDAPPQISIMPDGSSSPDEDELLQPLLTPIKPLHTPKQTPKRSESVRNTHTSPSTATPASATTMPTSPGGLLSPLSPSVNMDPMQLAFEVQRRAEAATAALRQSPSMPKMNEGNGAHPRKRISPDKISAPTLVSASTSVDAIPLRSPTATPTPVPQQSSGKIGSRFKKLRGTIRVKNQSPNGDEVTPYPLNLKSPGTDINAPAHSSPNLALRTDAVSIVTPPGSGEPTRLKPPAPLPSPPASATPGLKGFMARFRKQRATPEPLAPSSLGRRAQPQQPSSAKSTVSSGSSPDQPYAAVPHSAPALQTVFRSTSPMGPPQSTTPRPSQGSGPPRIPSQPHTDQDALRQLFDAATNLGLDQAALNDLIARSPSTTPRSTAWTKLTRATSTKSQLPVIRGRATPDSIRSPTVSEGRPSVDAYSPRPSTDLKTTGNKSQDMMQRPRAQQPRQDTASNAIVRRTIIFPSDSRASALDLTSLMRKQSTTSRRRASIGSNRSVHDRVPTPPPPHRGGGRRFSTDGAPPPMPQLPPALSATSGDQLSSPNQSGTAHEPLYELYSGDSRGQLLSAESAGGPSSQAYEAIPESGPALEVVEMANGETIWSIVNGLRDDDGESFYGDRASFYSEYSVKDADNVKLFFKEHERKSSKSSMNSFLSRKKPRATSPSKGTARPETKVFFSSSAQIGRLIENLSRGMDAGSFNIMPGRSQGHPGHSASSSLGSEVDMRWTVEERLEHMLGSMGAS